MDHLARFRREHQQIEENNGASGLWGITLLGHVVADNGYKPQLLQMAFETSALHPRNYTLSLVLHLQVATHLSRDKHHFNTIAISLHQANYIERETTGNILHFCDNIWFLVYIRLPCINEKIIKFILA